MSELESRLQAWAQAEAAAAGEPPTFEVAPRRTPWVPAALATAAALVVAAGGLAVLTQGSSSPAHPGSDRVVVPWAPLPPPQPAMSPSPDLTDDPSARACTASDLRAVVTDAGQGATGSWVASFDLANVSSTPCRLTGELDGLSGVLDGTRRAIHVSHGTPFADLVPVVLAPGRSGQVFYSYYRRCDTTQPAIPPVYRDLELTLLGGVLPVAGASLDLGCDPPTTGIAASALGAVPAQGESTPPASAHLTPTLQVPASVQAGQQLRYTVTLTNPTNAPVTFDPCPGYLEALFSGEALVSKETWGLNCAQAQPVAGHGSETFAMELAVPADAPAGSRLLTWQLAPTDAKPAHAIVEVRKATTSPSQTPSPDADVVGLDVDSALLRLQKADCMGSVGAIVNGAAPVGQVLSQRTTSDLCEIELTVSAGPRSTAQPCTHLTVTSGEVGAGLGHAGFPIRFRNTARTVCSLTGYPAVTARDSKTGRTVTARKTLSGYLGGGDHPLVTYFLAPGQQVAAFVEGTDNPLGNATSCSDLTHLRATVNGRSYPLDPQLWNCSGMEVHPFLPGTSGRA